MTSQPQVALPTQLCGPVIKPPMFTQLHSTPEGRPFLCARPVLFAPSMQPASLHPCSIAVRSKKEPFPLMQKDET